MQQRVITGKVGRNEGNLGGAEACLMRGDGLELAGGRDASTGLLLSVRRSSGLQNWKIWQRAEPEFLLQVLKTVDAGVERIYWTEERGGIASLVSPVAHGRRKRSRRKKRVGDLEA